MSNIYYWQGSTAHFDESAGILSFQNVKFDSKAETLSLSDTDTGEMLIEGLDEGWILTERLSGNMVPTKIAEIDEFLKESLVIKDDNVLSKLRKFAKNKEEAVAHKSLLKRTFY
jgi:hypothetical protein